MHIALTGATGFIGRYIVRELTRAGHTVRCWYRPESDRSGFDEAAGRIEWREGTLGDEQAAADLVAGCDAVVHSALHHPGGGFRGGEGELTAFAQTNIIGTLQLIEAARKAGLGRFVFVSSCAVHDKILDDRPLDEAHPLWASNHYGAHKAAIEKFVHSYGFGSGFPICAVRPTGVYGVAQPVQHSKWFDLVRDVAQGKDVTCQRGGKEVHAADVAKAVSLLLETDAEQVTGQAFNCYDAYVSEWDVAHIAQKVAGSSGNIEGRQTAPKHQIVTDKLRKLGMQFGGQPLLRESITELVKSVTAG